MDIFHVIASVLERETGFACVPEQANIEDQQIMIAIQSIEQLERPQHYGVHGRLTFKTTSLRGWTMLTTLLNLSLTGTRARAHCAQIDGFSAMRLDFSIVVQDQQGRISYVRAVDRFITHTGDIYVD